MKRLLLVGVAACLAASGALAADLPAAAAPPVFPPVPVFSWSGFYIGANAGYGFGVGGDRTRGYDIAFPADANAASGGFTNTNPQLGGVGTPINIFTLPTTLSLGGGSGIGGSGGGVGGAGNQRDGFVGGAQIGYNLQLTPGNGVVIGIEADAQYADFGSGRGTTALTLPASVALIGPPVFNPPASVDRVGEPGRPGDFDAGLRSVTFLRPDRSGGAIDWFGTVRGRLGYAVDRVLFYGTGGFAYGASGRGNGTGFGDRDGIRTGWTAGGGVEFALPSGSWLNFLQSSAVTIKVEALYVSLDQDRRPGAVLYARDQNGYAYYAPAGLVSSGASRDRQDDFVVARVGLNYKF